MVDLSSLNESQRNAVLCIDKPSLVIAGAGSGKTRVLTYKIAYLLESGFAPDSILALTFTKKAANEMKERIASMVSGEMARRLWMGTFHSVFMRILQREHDVIGFPANFTIYDNTDSKNLVKSIIKDLELDEKVYKPADVFYRISSAKNNLLSPNAYLKDNELMENDRLSRMPSIGKIYKIYWDRCRQSGVMDFDDLLVYTFLLFEKSQEICAKYSSMFRYILVDEYQDTNFAQHRIILQLAKNNPNVCVVGDDAQSIYSFRGAKIDNILTFSKYFPDTRIFKLEQNYRSTQNIVSAANSLIEKNRRQIRKSTFSEGQVGNRLQLISAYTDIEEASIVVNRIANMISRGVENDEIAILYRTNSQSRMFEEELRKRGIAYKIYGGMSFYQRKEIKDMMAYFRLIANPNDEEAFKRVINYPKRGIGPTTVDKIMSVAIQNSTSMWNVASSPLDYNLSVSSAVAKKLSDFCVLVKSLIEGSANGMDAAAIAQKVYTETGIKHELSISTDVESQGKKENTEELLNSIAAYCKDTQEETGKTVSIYDYLTEISLISELEEKDDDVRKKVNLMTVHAAKGLEFSNVFIVGLEERLFPYIMTFENPAMIEEERRLCYVAITRAKENCFLSYAKSRFKFGQTEFCRPSRFIMDINPMYIEEARPVSQAIPNNNGDFKPQVLKKLKRTEDEVSVQKTVSSEFGVSVGERIRHERFGSGTIVSIEGDGENTKAVVEFENVGKKQLLLKYAKFQKIG